MEAMPIVNITQEAVIKFLQSIVFRFNIPRWVLMDNGTQFKGANFSRCCVDFDIEHEASSVTHP
jgi:transposase InsO family protein